VAKLQVGTGLSLARDALSKTSGTSVIDYRAALSKK
jgi:hypothetical protein